MAVTQALVTYNAEGKPNSVQYRLLTPMLLDETQKQQRENAEQRQGIAALAKRPGPCAHSIPAHADQTTSPAAAPPGALPARPTRPSRRSPPHRRFLHNYLN